MPSEAEKARHGGVARVRSKKLSNGTTLTIYFFKDKKTYSEVRQVTPGRKNPGPKSKGGQGGTNRKRAGNAGPAQQKGRGTGRSTSK